jgi:hypothetical protein
MKQFFVFVYSHYSQASMNCDKIIKSLPPDVKFNYLCVDNPENRKIILNDSTLDINMVPCLLIVNTLDGRITKYDGKKCLDYLLQYKKQQTPLVEPLPISVTPAVVLQPTTVQQVPQPTQPVVAQPVQAIPVAPPVTTVPQKKINLPPPPHRGNDADDSFSNPPDENQTSSLSLLGDDDEENENDYGPPLQPTSTNNKKRMITQQQAPPPPQPKAKPSLLAQATAMQKSRLADEKNNLN